jgi:hypothetical protein
VELDCLLVAAGQRTMVALEEVSGANDESAPEPFGIVAID